MRPWYERNLSAVTPPDPVEQKPAAYRRPRRRRPREPRRITIAAVRRPTEWRGS